jgi:polar amino acid transport system substrate-binding protein
MFIRSLSRILCISFFLLPLHYNKAFATSVTVGVESLDYLPFYSGKGRAGYNGFAREVFDRFAEEKGHEFIYIPVKVTSLFTKYINKEFDFKFPDNSLWRANEKTSVSIKYSDAVVQTEMGVMSLAGNGGKQLKNVGVVDGFTPYPLLGDVKTGKLKLVKKNKMRQLIKLLIKKEIDGIYGSIDVLNYHAKKIKQKVSFEFNKNVKVSIDEFFLSSIKKGDVLDEFNVWLKSNSGEIIKLKKKHGIN